MWGVPFSELADELWFVLRLLLILATANSAPIFAKHLFGAHWGWPLDGGATFLDGKPLLGPSKTVRGVVASIVGAALAAALLDFSPATGAVMGAMAMLGDALSSFVKRRLGITSSGRATGLDQIPEALLPLLAVYGPLALLPLEVVTVTVAFFLLEIPLAKVSFRWGLRDRPY